MKRNIFICTLTNRDNTDKINVIITLNVYNKYADFISHLYIVPNSSKLTPLKDILKFIGDTYINNDKHLNT